jgi:hypothetical protein
MTPWPAIPDLPGHVVETSRREDGARRRLDLFVHPEGLQPHHVAIRLDLWEGRAPELHAGFGAEARPVCLPEHLDPQQRAVEAAAGLVAQVAGEPAAAQLRERWAAAREGLEGRMAEIEALAHDSSQTEFGLSKDGTIYLRLRPTRPHERRVFVQAWFGKTYRSTQYRIQTGLTDFEDAFLEKPTIENVEALLGLSNHDKLDLASGGHLLRRRLLRALIEGDPAYPLLASPSSLAGYVAWTNRQRDRIDTPQQSFAFQSPFGCSGSIHIAEHPNGEGRCLHGRFGFRDGPTAVVFSTIRQDTQSGTRNEPTIWPDRRDIMFHSREEADKSIRAVVEAIIACDPDIRDVVLPDASQGSASPVSLAGHRLLRDLVVPRHLGPIVGAFAGLQKGPAKAVFRWAEAARPIHEREIAEEQA